MKKSSRSYLKRLIRFQSKKLVNSKQDFASIFDISFSFKDEIMFEYLDKEKARKLTYEQVKKKIIAFANYLIEELKDYPQDSFIALKMDNCPEWIISFWAILMSGYRPLLINTRMNDTYNLSLINKLNIKVLISFTPLGELKLINPKGDYHDRKVKDYHFSNEIALSTSGTTGEPKICLYNGKDISEQILNSLYVTNKNFSIASFYHHEFKHLAFLPFYHIFGLTAMFLWFSFFGREFVFLKDYAPNTIMETCKRFNVTIFFAIPEVWNVAVAKLEKEVYSRNKHTIRKYEKGLKLSTHLQNIFPHWGKHLAIKMFKSVRQEMFGNSLKFLITGGGFISSHTLYVLNALGYSLYNGYGMSELGITSVELSLKPKKRNLGSIGKPFPSVEYCLSDEHELLVKGDSLHECLFIHDHWINRDKNNFYHTGDIASIDKHGRYYIKGRKDDLIIRDNGELISPDYVESFFNKEYMNALCAFATLDQRNIILVIEAKHDLNEFQKLKLLEGVKADLEKVPSFMRPQDLYWSKNELPMLMKGNIQRNVLRTSLLNSPDNYSKIDFTDIKNNDFGESLDEIEKKLSLEICTVFGEVFQKEITDININFLTDLSGNSMQYFELMNMLNDKYHVEIVLNPNELLLTPLDFARYIRKNS